MKILIATKPQGGTLIVTILTTALLGLTLASYLDLTSAQNLSTMRSLAWNSTMPVLEAGIEEALTQLYYTSGTNLSRNGWTLLSGSNQYYKWRSLGDAWVFTIISNTSPPIVYARGYKQIPLQNGQWLTRLVKVETRQDGLFSRGLVAKGQITLNGNSVLVDSFDSTDPNYSTNGVYTVSRRKANGTVASNSQITNAIVTGNANIFGRTATGPGGSVKIGPNGAVGDLAWQTSSTGGIQSGHLSSDMNVSFPDVTPPFSGGAFTPAWDGSDKFVISSSGNYELSSLHDSLLVKSNANAVLIVDGSINLTGNDSIEIQQGGSLRIYVKGTTASIGGNGVVNHNGSATNFFYFGLPGNTSLSIAGNGSFTGVIYAPSADFTLNGGGSGEGITGASVTGSARMNGNFQFHYDESLANLPFNRGFIVTSWNEI